MDQKKIGLFLKELRNEKRLTQEALAEELNVSGRTISRWETGSNLPDISLLVALSEFYQVSIPEIIDGHRKGENMNSEAKDTAVKMAEYSQNETTVTKAKTVGFLLIAFGVFIMISALAMFPSDSSWGGVYSIIGGMVLTAGVYFAVKCTLTKRLSRIGTILGCVILLFGVFSVSDYIAVSAFNQVPRFRYESAWSSQAPDQIVYKTIFFTAVQKNRGTEKASVEIVK